MTVVNCKCNTELHMLCYVNEHRCTHFLTVLQRLDTRTGRSLSLTRYFKTRNKWSVRNSSTNLFLSAMSRTLGGEPGRSGTSCNGTSAVSFVPNSSIKSPLLSQDMIMSGFIMSADNELITKHDSRNLIAGVMIFVV